MTDDALVFGAAADPGLVAVETAARKGGDEAVLFFRRGSRTVEKREPFEPFIVTDKDVLPDCPVRHEGQHLEGGGRLNICARFRSWKDCQKAREWLAKATRRSASSPDAPYFFVADPVQQHLMLSGRTLFKGMRFDDVRRLQVDIECRTTAGYEFCHAAREGDRIIAIAVGDPSGGVHVLSGAEQDEAEMLRRFVALVRELDPDVIEGHNVFNFDLSYIAERARRHDVPLALGRDGSAVRTRASRMNVGERTIAYTRFDVYGRHVVDTLFLTQAYDVTHRSLDSFGLKSVAAHFGVSAPDRTLVDGGAITGEFDRDPERVLRYVRDDAIETRAVSGVLSTSAFVQAQIVPYSYQNICVRGHASKIDALMVREYLRRGHALPLPDKPRPFAGGYTDVFVEGIVQNVHHCDVRSLYPSLMLTRNLRPKADELGAFLQLLRVLRDFRLDARERMVNSGSESERKHFDALQSTFKVFINSFYGYLGFDQARFSDFDAAEQVTAHGRALLKSMIEWMRAHGGRPIEIDTDGIYFVPPEPAAVPAFRSGLAASLPDGIDLEFDAQYRSMYSYRMKNYALLADDGEVVIKGAALKSRGLEPFQRDLLREIVRLRLEARESEIPALVARYQAEVRERRWPIHRLAKTETLQDSLETYRSKVSGDARARSAAYELALRSGREYRPGDQVSYYVTGNRKSVAVHESSRLASEWDPANRDENVAYYLAKVDAIHRKLCAAPENNGLDGD